MIVLLSGPNFFCFCIRWCYSCFYTPSIFITARKRSLRRLCFHRCLSVQGGVSRSVHAGIAPPEQTLPSGQTPLEDTPPSGQKTSLGRAPRGSACWDMVNKRAVRIPLEFILVGSSLCLRISQFLFPYVAKDFLAENRCTVYIRKTRLHSSRMRTARL